MADHEYLDIGADTHGFNLGTSLDGSTIASGTNGISISRTTNLQGVVSFSSQQAYEGFSARESYNPTTGVGSLVVGPGFVSPNAKGILGVGLDNKEGPIFGLYYSMQNPPFSFSYVAPLAGMVALIAPSTLDYFGYSIPINPYGTLGPNTFNTPPYGYRSEPICKPICPPEPAELQPVRPIQRG